MTRLLVGVCLGVALGVVLLVIVGIATTPAPPKCPTCSLARSLAGCGDWICP